MFVVINRNDKKPHTVYKVHYDEKQNLTFFLIYDKVYGWNWYNSDRYIPEGGY